MKEIISSVVSNALSSSKTGIGFSKIVMEAENQRMARGYLWMNCLKYMTAWCSKLVKRFLKHGCLRNLKVKKLFDVSKRYFTNVNNEKQT